MKKIISIVLALLLMGLCAYSSAEESDPIVGLWYVLFSKDNTPPSLWEILNLTSDRVAFIFDCQSDGEVFAYEILFNDSIGETESEFFAKWEKDSENYIISMIGLSKFKAYFKEESLYFDLFGSDVYLKMRKVDALDWFNDTLR